MSRAEKVEHIIKSLVSIREDLLEEDLLTRCEACDLACNLISLFDGAEWGEEACEYLRRHMAGDIYCQDCGEEMPKDHINYYYCDKCSGFLEGKGRPRRMIGDL